MLPKDLRVTYSEKYRQVTTARCSAVHESRNYWRKTKMEERRRIERKPRWNRRRGRRHRREDRRRENAAIAPCSRHSRNRTVRRRSQIDTTGKSSRSGFFFRKMRFRQELGDDAKNCCGGRENGLSSLIGLPNGEIWRTSARVCDFIACPSTFSYFRKLRGSFDFAVGRD